ncbi:hypothetical protein R1flu_003263 [Riccia fluitans]|uniref:Uncharacterized protein n=1 Tax=Riccia fluitans TaxID=41844 RepID=A0ABD1Y8N6_9MARC
MCADIDVPNRRGEGDRSQDDESNPELSGMAPPLWTAAAAGEGEGDANQVDVEDSQMGYEPIRAEAARTGGESHGEGNNNSPAGNGIGSGHLPGSNGARVSGGQNLQERIVTVNDMEFHVYGNVSGLELLTLNSDREENLHLADSDEEEEEERRRAEAERAIDEANRAHEARRAAPIPPENRARILNAMKEFELLNSDVVGDVKKMFYFLDIA